MQKTPQILVGFFALVALAFPGENKQKSYEALRQRALEATDVFAADPLQIHATFHLQVLGGKWDGVYQYRQLSKDEYREDIQAPNFSESIVNRSGDRYFVRTRPVEPLPISYLHQLIFFRRMYSDPLLSKVTTTVENGRNATCFIVERGMGPTEFNGYTACFDVDTAVLVRKEISVNTEVRRFEYSNFLHDGQRLFPSKMRMLLNGNAVAEVNVDFLNHASTELKLLDPPPNSSKEVICRRFQPAEADYSHEYFQIRSSYNSGSVVIAGLVDDHGKVQDAEIQQLGRDAKMDETALNALKEVHIHAAKCDGRPIPSAFRLQIWFSPALHPDSFQSFR